MFLAFHKLPQPALRQKSTFFMKLSHLLALLSGNFDVRREIKILPSGSVLLGTSCPPRNSITPLHIVFLAFTVCAPSCNLHRTQRLVHTCISCCLKISFVLRSASSFCDVSFFLLHKLLCVLSSSSTFPKSLSSSGLP